MNPHYNAQAIVREAKKRGWDYKFLIEGTTYIALYPPGQKPIFLHSSLTELSAGFGYEVAENKLLLYRVISDYDISMPKTIEYENMQSAFDFLAENKRIVVKPADTDHGIGITLKVDTESKLDDAIKYAQKYSSQLLLQSFHEGNDYRLLVISGKVVAISQRVAAFVIGDGVSTVRSLINQKNSDPLRGEGYELPLTKIPTEEAERYMGDSIESVPEQGNHVQVIGVANVSKGGESISLNDVAHAEVKNMAVGIAEALGLGVAGIDIISKDIECDIETGGTIVIEVNKMPGYRVHELPVSGKAINVTSIMLDEIMKARNNL